MEKILTMPAAQEVFAIDDSSQVAVVRRAGAALTETLGFDASTAGRVALVITEAATNILKHAGHGRILLRPVLEGGASGVEVLVIDAGPGISNLPLKMTDGHSTVGSYGDGLGTMLRQSDVFDIYSAPGAGTALYMLVTGVATRAPALWPKLGVVCLPLPGEGACGDAWAVVESAGCYSVLVADGLGHGPLAALASRAAVTAAQASAGMMPTELMWKLDGALKGTRGAAAALARIDLHAGSLHFAGVGNIAASIHQAGARRHLVSHNGIVGSKPRKVQEFHYPWAADSMLVMHSDGVGTRWDLEQYPGLAFRHPGLIAAVLYRDFSRTSDDATVLVLRDH